MTDTPTEEERMRAREFRVREEHIDTLNFLSNQYLPGGPRDIKGAIRAAIAALRSPIAGDDGMVEAFRAVLPSGAGTDHLPDSKVIPFYITLGELRNLRAMIAAPLTKGEGK